MGGVYLDAGAFRDQLILQENEQSSDGCGGFTDGWRNITMCWARILPGKPSTQLRGDTVEASNVFLIDIRQPEMVVAGMRFQQSVPERSFDISAVYDPDETGRYWRCECRVEGLAS